LSNCPTVAYSGELDAQKQAADAMAAALAAEGMTLEHIIGPGAHHFYEAHAKQEVAWRVDSIMAQGRDPMPTHVRMATYMLRYNDMDWVTVDAMDKEWSQARVDAEIMDPHTVRVRTSNVSAITLSMEPGLCPLDAVGRPE